MTWRVPPIDQAVAEMVAHVRAAYAPRGIVVAGSIVRGEAGPTSDLDVWVIHVEPWRMRVQMRFAGVPAELFINPPAQVRRYFVSEHERGRPSTAHMLATGEPIAPVDAGVEALIEEAKVWMARPVVASASRLEQMAYGAVDALDNARDVIEGDPAAARLLLAEAVAQIVEVAFWRAQRFQPRRKAVIAALAALDPVAGELARRWAASDGREALASVEALARHVLGVDTFFAWSSERETVAIDEPQAAKANSG